MVTKKAKTRLISNSGKIALRARRTGKGESLYLDYRINGKRQYDFLKLILSSGSGLINKDKNKEVLRIAESLRAKRELEIHSGTFNIATKSKLGSNFIAYFDAYILSYTKKDYRLLISTLSHFKAFIKSDTIPCAQVNEKLLRKFKDYLDEKFNGETPFNYFKKLKKVIRDAVKEDYFHKNPADGIVNRKTEGVKKDVLDFEEIQLLAKTACKNQTIKSAALFCCMTGLRFCDINELRWKHIQKEIMRIVQKKTGVEVLVNLNASALKLLPPRRKPEDLIFNLPSTTTCQNVIDDWVKVAEINKHITWHCFRHSFGTNLIIFGADVRSASSLLGHTTLMETQKYVRLVDSMKESAVYKLPEINL
jgi:site-specific recombinase XerD